MDGSGLLLTLLLMALLALALGIEKRHIPAPVWPPEALALEVAWHRRYCPEVALRICPLGPRRGAWRLR